MADILDDKAALAYLLKQVLLADADAPIALALKQARVQTASGLMSLEVSQDMPLTYGPPTEGSDKAKKNIPLLPAEMCLIRGLKDYICYHMTNVANKYYESLKDWEKLTAKNFVSFRVNIAPTLPPNATPSAQVQVTKPSPVTNNPLRDWRKGTKRDMNIFKELKRIKEWKQWDTQFRADVATQGLSNILDPHYLPATYEDKMLFREQQRYFMMSLSVSSRRIKGRLSFENTRVSLTPKVFTRNFRNMLPNLLKPSSMPTLFSSISPLPVLVMVPGMVRPDTLFSIGWNKSDCTKNLLMSPPHCQTP